MNASNSPPVILMHVGRVFVTEKGTYYFQATFKLGKFGKPVLRTFTGIHDDEAGIKWTRCSPEEMQELVGEDVSQEVFIEAVEVEPYPVTYVDTGRVVIFTSRTVVRFCDESQEQAIRRIGLTPKEEKRTPEWHQPVAHQPMWCNSYTKRDENSPSS